MSLTSRLSESRRSGSVLVFTLAVLAMLITLTGVALVLTKNELGFSHRYYAVKQARAIAEGGVDYAVRQLNTSTTYTGSSNVALGDGVFTVIVSGSGDTRTVQSIGYVPNAVNP